MNLCKGGRAPLLETLAAIGAVAARLRTFWARGERESPRPRLTRDARRGLLQQRNLRRARRHGATGGRDRGAEPLLLLPPPPPPPLSSWQWRTKRWCFYTLILQTVLFPVVSHIPLSSSLFLVARRAARVASFRDLHRNRVRQSVPSSNYFWRDDRNPHALRSANRTSRRKGCSGKQRR